MEANDDLQTLLAEQRRELAEAEAVESDHNFAFQIQMQEAMKASLSTINSDVVTTLAGSSSPTFSDSDNFTISSLLAEEISSYEQHIIDHQVAAAEMNKIQSDLNRSIHDHAFAREIQNVPYVEWMNIGDNIEKPYRGLSFLGRDIALSSEDSFRVHVKGLIRVEEDGILKKTNSLAGIGVAICDMNDEMVLEVTKGLIGGEISALAAEVKAVIEGLNVAIMLGLKRIVIVTCCNSSYHYITTKKRPRESNLSMLFDQVTIISRKLDHFGVSLVQKNDLKFAVKLAGDALLSHARQALRNDLDKNVVETCVICMENISRDQMFQIDGCLHLFCFSCMRSYVQVKLLQSKLPKCPHEGCKSELNVEDCKKFLSPELFVTLNQRIMEASLDPAEKIYCPYPACSALMSRSEIPGGSGGIQASVRKCTKCHQRFCIDCKVPWHDNMTCHTYKQLNPSPPEDSKLKSLATESLWRQCPKCSHMVSLGEGAAMNSAMYVEQSGRIRRQLVVANFGISTTLSMMILKGDRGEEHDVERPFVHSTCLLLSIDKSIIACL